MPRSSRVRRVTVTAAKAHLSELIDAALHGEDIVIARRDVPLVRLAVVEAAKARPQFGKLAGKVKIAPDFDKQLEDFAEYW